MTDPTDFPLEELDREESWRLLATQSVGRLAVSRDGDAPLVVPVNFILDGDHVVFRSDAGTKLSLMRRHPVSFQVDAFDWPHRTGWSVLVTGRAYVVTHWESDHLTLASWAKGDKPHWVRIKAETVSGRALRLPDAVHGDRRGYL